MRQPLPAGTVLQALEPLCKLLTEREQSVLAGQGLQILTLVLELVNVFLKVGNQALTMLLMQAAHAEPTRARCTCGSMGSSKGFEHRYVITRFGRVEFERRRMGCDACERSWFPLDLAWGFTGDDYTSDLREATLRLACRLCGYREAVAELKELWGVAPEATTARLWLLSAGQQAVELEQSEAKEHWKRYEEDSFAVARGDKRASARVAGYGVVEADGVNVLTWKPGCEPRRKKTEDEQASDMPERSRSEVMPPEASFDVTNDESQTSETGERSLRHQPPSVLSEVAGSPMGPVARSERVCGREVCVGLAYLGEDVCQETEDRSVLLDKRYVATLNDRKGFWPRLHLIASQQGVLSCQNVVRVTDGSTYLIEHIDELFSDQPLTRIIDIQHVRQHVWEAERKLTADKETLKREVAPLIKDIDDGKVDDVISKFKKQGEQIKGREKQKALTDVVRYLEVRKDFMDYPRYKDAGFPIASAAIESTNKRLVSRRLKQGGMIWGWPGLEAMVAIRVAFYNRDRWIQLWPHTTSRAAA